MQAGHGAHGHAKGVVSLLDVAEARVEGEQLVVATRLREWRLRPEGAAHDAAFWKRKIDALARGERSDGIRRRRMTRLSLSE